MSYPIRVRAGAIIIEQDHILLTVYEFPGRGIFYDLPAGGVEPNESITEAVVREAREEACVDVIVGPLAFVYEYAPHLSDEKFGPTPTLVMMFDCQRSEATAPRLPDNPDANQIDVRWVPLDTPV